MEKVSALKEKRKQETKLDGENRKKRIKSLFLKRKTLKRDDI